MRELANYVKQVASKMLVSSTPNTTFQKLVLASAHFVDAKHNFEKTSRVSSTRNTTFFENYALVYAKHYFCSAHLAGLGAAVPPRRLIIPKNIRSRLRETTLFKIYTQKLSKTLSKIRCKTYRCRLVHAKCSFFLYIYVSSTRNTTFLHQV